MVDQQCGEGAEEPELPKASEREINRRLRAERAEKKLLANLQRRGLGVGKELAQEVVSRWPRELDKQIEFFFDAIDLFESGRKPKLLGYDAKRRVRSDFQSVLYTLRGTPAEVADLTEITTDKALAAVALWCELGHSAATIQSKVSVLRRFLVLIGEPNVIPLRDKLEVLLRARGLEPERVRRRQQRPASSWARHSS